MPELKCPHCGEANLDRLQLGEWVYCSRNVRNWDGDTLVVDGLSEPIWEVCRDGAFYCRTCDQDFPMPAELDIDYED